MDVRRVKVVVPIPEKDIVYVKPGARLKVIIDALGSLEKECQVIFIKQEAEPSTLTFPVHLALDNPEGKIRAGMIARVLLVRRSFKDAVAVPIFSVIRRPDGYHVFVEENGVWRMTGHHARPLSLSGQNIAEDGGDDGTA